MASPAGDRLPPIIMADYARIDSGLNQAVKILWFVAAGETDAAVLKNAQGDAAGLFQAHCAMAKRSGLSRQKSRAASTANFTSWYKKKNTLLSFL